MSEGPHSLYRLGGIAFIVSGSLFLTKSLLELAAGPPPSNGADILVWIAAQKPFLMATSEVLFFGVCALIPAVVALHESMARTHPASAALGCGTIALTIPILAVMLVLQGRISYPVFEIQVHTPDIAELVVATYYGGLHAVALLFALGTLVMSLAMRRGPYGKPTAYLGFATAISDLIGGYPDRIGPVLWLVCGAFFAAWFVAVGVKLYGMSAASSSAIQRSGGEVTPDVRRVLS